MDRCSAHRLKELHFAHRYIALVCFLWQTSLDTIQILNEMNEDKKRKLPSTAPLDFMPAKLQSIVAPQGIVDKAAWEGALFTCLRDDIKAGNLSVRSSKRYGQFDNFFISDAEWKKLRKSFFARAGLPENPKHVANYFKNKLNIASADKPKLILCCPFLLKTHRVE